ncbi:MAG: hypothetical protein QW568_04285 [Candidatus Anstonellaceae archaeon]
MSVSLLFPATPLNSVHVAISQFCGGMTSLLPVAAMLMVLIGAVVYAAGQVMGAETRARANVWATAALTGALVAMLITAVAGPAVGMVYGGSVSCEGGTINSCQSSGSTCSSGGECCSGICSAYTNTCS